jgi:hypothetical protein
MPEWQKDLIELWELVVEVIDEIGHGLQEVVEEIAETMAADIETIGNEFKVLQEDWWAGYELPDSSEDRSDLPDSSELFDFSSLGEEDWPMYYEPRQMASPDFHPACVGCRNYHGTTFGGNLLVCGFHPYGWEEGTCPDWEAQ